MQHGLVPVGDGWFVVNAREAPWHERPGRGCLCEFEGFGVEGALDFEQLGINLTILEPGEPMSMYHRERDQEDFLVLAGEALLIIEGEERPLPWDFVHCPAGTEHVIIGAGSERCVRRPRACGRRALGPLHGGRSPDPPRRGRREGDDRFG